MKHNPCFLLLVSVVFVLASAATAQKRMQVTVVNDSPEPLVGVRLMSGSLVTGSYCEVRALPLSAPIRSSGSVNLSFDVEVLNSTVVQQRTFYSRKYAIEVLWGGGCKKLLDLNYELVAQSVNAGAKQCGLYKFEIAAIDTAKRDGDRTYGEKQYDLAESYYSDVIRIDPKNEYALHRRGHARMALKQFVESAADFTAALEVSTNKGHLYSDRGNAYYGAKDYVRAAADFGRAYGLAPNNTNLTNRWASLCLAGKDEEAEVDRKKLVELGVTLNKTCIEFRQMPRN